MTVPTVALSVTSRAASALHFDRFADLSDLQFEIDASRLLHLQFNLIPDDGLEAGLLGPQRVGSGRQRRERIDARIVGDYGADRIRTFVGGRYRDAGDNRPGGIARLSVDRAKRLAEGGISRQHKARQNKYSIFVTIPIALTLPIAIQTSRTKLSRANQEIAYPWIGWLLLGDKKFRRRAGKAEDEPHLLSGIVHYKAGTLTCKHRSFARFSPASSCSRR